MNMYQYLDDSRKKQFFNIVLALGVILSVFIAVKAINAVKEYSNIGKGVYPSNVVSVTGMGEVVVIPDVASFSFSVIEEGDDVAEAQNKSAEKMNTVLEAIDDLGVEEKDIQTTGYNIYPKYEYTRTVCTEFSCPPGRQVLIGYEVSQTITIKIRETSKAGEALSKVGQLGVSNVSGLNFIVDDMEKVKAEARAKAIADAKAKAKILSKSLNVSLVDIVGFYENDPYYPYAKGMGVAESYDARLSSVTPAVIPDVPVGENKITSNVTITYEIR